MRLLIRNFFEATAEAAHEMRVPDGLRASQARRARVHGCQFLLQCVYHRRSFALDRPLRTQEAADGGPTGRSIFTARKNASRRGRLRRGASELGRQRLPKGSDHLGDYGAGRMSAAYVGERREVSVLKGAWLSPPPENKKPGVARLLFGDLASCPIARTRRASRRNPY